MKVKAVIIDDDHFMSEVLKDLLTENHPAIEVVGIANNGFSGLKAIEQTHPDLIFLDVEMYLLRRYKLAANHGSVTTPHHRHSLGDLA